MTDGVRDADRQLAEAVQAVASIDRDDLPDGVSDDVEMAMHKLLKAKGHCEVNLSKVSGI